MKDNKLKPLRPVTILFVLFTSFFSFGKDILQQWGANKDVLILGNFLLFLVTIISYLMLYRGARSANPQSFVRAMYGSFIVKFFVIALAAFVYILVARQQVSKAALIICMLIYMIYTVIEVSALIKLMKQKKNA